ncbi:hypothetical protein BCR22_07395 [Enterococcus plantarum]|uniref:tail assembly chaperone n=1 Tax=Enterococcus plantarum TaxID=1077675 RepID=UPI00084D9825|nr:tail assembly chaperone [Enterococcus plantarum]OEG09411.1 hypothetical protein BCR22_07395 [Enterococcus plantarum]
MELEINGEVYQFVFGFGFVKEMNKRFAIDGRGMKMNAGIDTVVTNLYMGDIEILVEVLKVANLTEKPRVSEKDIIEHIGQCDVDTVFDKVMDGLKESGFTKRKTLKLVEEIEKGQK